MSKPSISKPIDRIAVVSSHFQDDLLYWIETDRKAALRVLDLMTAILADPLVGIGKPDRSGPNWPAAGAAASLRSIG